jgi:predicted ATPase
MNLISKTPKIELLLHPHQVLNLDDTDHRMAIECKSGVIWVTHTGENQDYMLSAGKRYTSKNKGKIIVEAIDESCLGIEEE